MSQQHLTSTAPSAAASSASTASATSGGGLLRTVLRENAIFSMLSGAFLAIGGAKLDNWIGLNQWILIGVGVTLIAYGELVWIGANNDKTLKATGQTAVLGDIGWIIGAIVIVAATSWLTANGERLLLGLSVPVLAFAVGQTLGLRRLSY